LSIHVVLISGAKYKHIISCLRDNSDEKHDSGLHVLCNAEALAEFALHNGRIKDSLGATKEDFEEGRRKILKIVSQLASECEDEE